MSTALPLKVGARSNQGDTTRALVGRLWREHIKAHRGLLLLILLLTAITAAAQATYPVMIQRAIDMFEQRDRRILYQVPVLVIIVTSIKALAQYFQSVLVQRVVLLVIRELAGADVRPSDARRPGAGGARGAGRAGPRASPPTPPPSARR